MLNFDYLNQHVWPRIQNDFNIYLCYRKPSRLNIDNKRLYNFAIVVARLQIQYKNLEAAE